jgi:hypothetical protein
LIRPEHTDACLWLADVLRKRGKPDEAAKWERKWKEKGGKL